ncbi:RING-type E3 ubiquitin transferase [Trifolium repens]|nr:RING-type E3 ubiquitin transferase [Trifolium repens]
MAQRKRLNMEIDIDINCDVIDARDHQPIDAGMCYPAQFSPKFARSTFSLSSKDDDKQLFRSDDSSKKCDLPLSDIQKGFQCPICLGIIKKAKIVKQCNHRFCKECIEKAFRLSNHKCPICRVHCPSRRALMDDVEFDSKIASSFPYLEKSDQEEMTLNAINKKIEKTKQKTCKAILEKQHDAASMSTKDGGVKEIIESSRRSEAEQPIPQDNVLASPNNLMDFIRSSSSLAWKGSGQRSNNRAIANNTNANRSNNRISRLIEHLRNLSRENKDELDIFVKFISFEEERVPNMRISYLLFKPTMSISQLCEYVALETSLQTEEIELYVIKECQPNIILGDARLDPSDIKSELLTREEQTLAELVPENLNRGHLSGIRALG